MVVGVATGVSNNGAVMGFKIIFHNSSNERYILVGCPMVVQSSHGGWMHGGEGIVGSLFFLVPHWVVVLPPLQVSRLSVVVVFSPIV